MSIVQALTLGAIQGLTEFFPISSSGHLVLARWLFGWSLGSPDLEKSFDAATHLGTALAATLLMRKELGSMARSLIAKQKDRHAHLDVRLVALVALASLPAGVAGSMGERFVEERLTSVLLVAFQLAFFAVLLMVFDRLSSKKRPLEDIGSVDALVIGTAQVLALSPGVSRSGITITAGLGRGLGRTAAVRFSFLLLIPVTAGAGLFKLISLLNDGRASPVAVPFLVGILSSALTGFVAAKALLALVRTKSFLPFVLYRIAVGLCVVALWVVRA